MRLSSKTVRRKAQAGIATTLAEGLDAARDLDVIVAIATRQSDPTTYAAWTTARRIEGRGSSAAKASVTPPDPEPVAATEPVPVVAPLAPPAPAAPPVSVLPVPALGELEKAS
ncbi:MAG: hypothetical protein AB7O28_15785 [Vicinamibacterales bacterium]